MSETERSETLVQVHHARDEWEGNIVVGYLRDNGIESTLQGPESTTPWDVAESLGATDKANGVFVLEHEAEHARGLLKEFLAMVTDDQILEETAAQKLKLDKETIGQLRRARREERRTFEFLGWIGVAFLGSAALLWAIWPDWLKIAAPASALRWMVVILLALAAVFAGSWTSKHHR
jgi:hypothetical protein